MLDAGSPGAAKSSTTDQKTPMKRSGSLALFVTASIFAGGLAVAQIDTFDDGDDAGWTRVSPLTAVGVSATYSFPGGDRYRIQCPEQPNEAFGPPRAGSLRADVSYSDFHVQVDLVDFDPAADVHHGLLARVRQPGIGTLDGYAWVYNPVEARIYLTVVTDEDSEVIADAEVFPSDIANPLRLVLGASGSTFRGAIYELVDGAQLLAEVEVDDATYASGFCGILNVSDPLTQATDSTFDNYFAAAEAPGAELRITGVERDGDMLRCQFLGVPGGAHVLESSGDLAQWGEIDDSILAGFDGRGEFTVPIGEGEQGFRLSVLE